MIVIIRETVITVSGSTIFFHMYSNIQDSLKFISRLIPITKFRSVDIIMTSYLQNTSYFFIKWILLYCLSLLL